MRDVVNPTCPVCGVQALPEANFCEACGRDLRPEANPAPCAACDASAISADGYCERCGRRQPGGRDHVEIELAGTGAVSDRGLRHHRNEDAMALSRLPGPTMIAVVCDGVSSSPRPQDASQTAADTGVALLGEELDAGADPQAATAAAAAVAAEAVAGLAETRHNAPACTYVSAIVTADSVVLGWVGDSRAYWLATGDGASAVLTEDDSWAGRMVALGALSEAQAQANRWAHMLTGWMGADASVVDTHVKTFTPVGPGAVLVCSDGLWNYLPEADALAEAAPHAADDPAGAARSLVRIALEAGGKDNVTVVVIPFPPRPDDSDLSAGMSTERPE